MNPSRAVVAGVAELLQAAGVGAWRPDGIYQPGEVPITVGLLPQSYDVAVALTVYGTEDDPALADSAVLLQARFRAGPHPDDANDLAATLFGLLQGREHFTLAGVPVIEAHRLSWAGLGMDENRRWERTDNYRLQIHHPTQYRPF
ncbi:minor capsid protein [Brachybacterium tyrofermentans]|uniref:minor capsid protein n=1 Tax=Brachybacterium tyrofermentans TaxID=47848 RepID=UPI001867C746|nr:minor capsid protein [Brachybacterium tyrofermentans]